MALPEALVRRAGRDPLGTPGVRTRQITLVTTLLDVEIYRVAALAARSRQRGQVEGCQTPPVKMSWCPLRRAPGTISDLRGFGNREPGRAIDLRARHDDLAQQAVRHRLALCTRAPVQMVTQPAPNGFGRLHALWPRPRLWRGAGSWRAFRLALRHRRGACQPPRVSCAQVDHLGLLGGKSALAWPLHTRPARQKLGLRRGEG